jgi:hypothetical protein
MFNSCRIDRWDSGWRFDAAEESAPDKQETAMDRLDALRDRGSWRLPGGKADAGPRPVFVQRLVDAFETLTPPYAEA